MNMVSVIMESGGPHEQHRARSGGALGSSRQAAAGAQVGTLLGEGELLRGRRSLTGAAMHRTPASPRQPPTLAPAHPRSERR
jgi:hypothetical protein